MKSTISKALLNHLKNFVILKTCDVFKNVICILALTVTIGYVI